ncbi:MAG: MotA/TolQ/ExbB proton channel family protein [Myxococcota bacterium]
MDISTIIGLVLSAFLVLGSILIGGPLSAFIDVAGSLIVFGGTVAATLVSETLPQCIGSIKVALNAFRQPGNDSSATIEKIVELSSIARREGILALENQQIEDTFFSKALRMAVDGTSPDEIRETLSSEVSGMKQRHVRGQKLFKFMAASAPSMGMIGTLIGLVQMLGALDDPSSIGPAMAVALLTTLYGAVLAFMIFGPIASKLERRSTEEAAHMNVVLDGIESIVKGQKAGMIRDKLEARLPPAERQEKEAA